LVLGLKPCAPLDRHSLCSSTDPYLAESPFKKRQKSNASYVGYNLRTAYPKTLVKDARIMPICKDENYSCYQDLRDPSDPEAGLRKYLVRKGKTDQEISQIMADERAKEVWFVMMCLGGPK
jgi:hypothetical protein